MMKPKIEFKNIWFDNDLTELRITVCNGISLFSNAVYIARGDTQKLIESLTLFGKQYHGGLFDLNLGNKGYEFASGAFEARLHYHTPGKIFISTFQQSEYFEFTERLEASESKMFLTTEPSSLDNFIIELKNIEAENDAHATLICT